jgi:hypothetical protein
LKNSLVASLELIRTKRNQASPTGDLTALKDAMLGLRVFARLMNQGEVTIVNLATRGNGSSKILSAFAAADGFKG